MSIVWGKFFITALLVFAAVAVVSIACVRIEHAYMPQNKRNHLNQTQMFFFQDPNKYYEKRLKDLQDQNVIDRSVKISMFYEWYQTRSNKETQGDAAFQEWVAIILGLTPKKTTTTTTTSAPPPSCVPCKCGRANSKRIVGGTEAGVHQYPWIAQLLYSQRFYCGASLISDRFLIVSFVNGSETFRDYLKSIFHSQTRRPVIASKDLTSREFRQYYSSTIACHHQNHNLLNER